MHFSRAVFRKNFDLSVDFELMFLSNRRNSGKTNFGDQISGHKNVQKDNFWTRKVLQRQFPDRNIP